MAEYADATTIKRKSGIAASDIGNVATATELDAFIATLNQSASEAVERVCNRDFEDHPNVTETYDGNDRQNEAGHGVLKLRGSPVRSISSIKIDGTVVDASEYRIKKAHSYDGVNAGIVLRKNTPWPEGWENIEVTYTWGFSSPPAGVKGVVEDLVVDALRVASRNESAEAAESVSMDGFSVTYFTGEIERNEKYKDSLRKYRKMALGRS